MRLHEIRQQISKHSGMRLSSGYDVADKMLRERGFRWVGSGNFSFVYEHPNFNYVLKLFRSDSCYIDFVKIAAQNSSNPHFPKFRGKMIHVIDEVYAVRMERLDGVSMNGRNLTNLLGYIISYLLGNRFIVVGAENPDILYARGEALAKNYRRKYPHLDAALDIIRPLLGECNLDIKSDNIMMRGDIPVITDPVWGWK